MKKQDKKDFPDRKNYIKLLPAAAVIAAVAVTGVQGKAGSTQKVQSESADVKDAEELTGLITTAYSYEDFSDGTSLQQKQAKLLPKRQKPESKKERQKHFRMNLRKLLRQDRELHLLRLYPFRKADIRMVLIREAAQDLEARSVFR